MAFQTVFKRYEMKYLLTLAQKERVLAAIRDYVQPDKYGSTVIRNLYFDTDSFLLARRSIDRPVYKEKLRLRSYARADGDSTVFVELKKKYRHVVYKRRISLREKDAMAWMTGNGCCVNTQISREIDYFRHFYGSLHPVVFLSYRREAYYSREDGDFRITFDDQVLCRTEALSLRSEVSGVPLLPEGMVLMELKAGGGIPLWMTRVLSREKIYKTSFSKYGTAYKNVIFPRLDSAGSNQQEVKQDV